MLTKLTSVMSAVCLWASIISGWLEELPVYDAWLSQFITWHLTLTGVGFVVGFVIVTWFCVDVGRCLWNHLEDY